jgi:hypothetical protein
VNSAEFDHAVRAAGAVLGVDEVIVVGSQALHGTLSGPLPDEAARSVEVDIVPPGDVDGSRADLVDGSIGEASMFHSTFGYYAQGVDDAPGGRGPRRSPASYSDRGRAPRSRRSPAAARSVVSPWVGPR